MVDNRRKYERKYITFFSRVLDRRSNALLGYLFDMTIEGAMIVGEIELIAETTLPTRIDLPEGLSARSFLDIDANVVWSRRDEADGTYKAGIKWEKTDPEMIKMLDSMIEHFGMAL